MDYYYFPAGQPALGYSDLGQCPAPERRARRGWYRIFEEEDEGQTESEGRATAGDLPEASQRSRICTYS